MRGFPYGFSRHLWPDDGPEVISDESDDPEPSQTPSEPSQTDSHRLPTPSHT